LASKPHQGEFKEDIVIIEDIVNIKKKREVDKNSDIIGSFCED